MLVLPFILAAGSLPLISGAPIPSSPSEEVSTHTLYRRESYVVMGGNGDVSVGWPSMKDWYPSVEKMLEANKDTISSSCAEWGVPNTSEQEMKDLSNAINEVAGETGVDGRYILGIVLQESKGCVRVPTTNNGVVNPGLMQSHGGTGSCNNGNVQNPCPASEIKQMITDGTAGTSSGPGLKQLIAQAGGAGVTAYYKTARLFNSGSIAPDGNLGKGIATHCYVSDVANRLIGWVTGESSCNSNTIGDLESVVSDILNAVGLTSSGPDPAPSQSSATPDPQPTTTSSTAPASTNTPETAPVVAAENSNPPAGAQTQNSSAAPVYPQAVPSCKQHYTVAAGDSCQKVAAAQGISASDLRSWNPGLDEACSNLWQGYQYCVKA